MSEKHEEPKINQEKPQTKRKYEAPKIKEYGTLSKLTAAAAPGIPNDGGIGTSNFAI